jgi:hypothetical protein
MALFQDIIEFRQSLNTNFGAFPTHALQAYKELKLHSAMISCGIPR